MVEFYFFDSLFFTFRYRNFRTFASPRAAQFSCLALDNSGEVVAAGALDSFEIYVWSVQTGRLLEVIFITFCLVNAVICLFLVKVNELGTCTLKIREFDFEIQGINVAIFVLFCCDFRTVLLRFSYCSVAIFVLFCCFSVIMRHPCPILKYQ